MLLKDILATKGTTILSIAPSASMADAVDKMVAHRCGCLVVTEGETMVGIISERDVLRAISGVAEPLDKISVEQRMTKEVITGTPEQNINDTMGLMTQNHVRHLPVLDEGRLAGLISIGDVVKAQHQKLAMENHLLMSYIQS
ncbi:MAG: CBS domain-containing protein [Planctomycetaceae bacterium]|nr:CBS domain-containing protein [Planctomycetales bacterium]MCB9920746.1 CBS domain-containing protein [Planctomycetaceae bacterium]